MDPGKRIHLRLEDLTPDEACQLKQDQIHVDEPAGHSGSHKVLHKCWQEAKFTSSSNTLYVVLLIGGWPSPPYRGFYGQYQAFGPPVVYHPQKGSAGRRRQSEPSAGLSGAKEFKSVMDRDQTELANSDMAYDYDDQHATMAARLPWVSSGAVGATKGGKVRDNYCLPCEAIFVHEVTTGTLLLFLLRKV